MKFRHLFSACLAAGTIFAAHPPAAFAASSDAPLFASGGASDDAKTGQLDGEIMVHSPYGSAESASKGGKPQRRLVVGEEDGEYRGAVSVLYGAAIKDATDKHGGTHLYNGFSRKGLNNWSLISQATLFQKYGNLDVSRSGMVATGRVRITQRGSGDKPVVTTLPLLIDLARGQIHATAETLLNERSYPSGFTSIKTPATAKEPSTVQVIPGRQTDVTGLLLGLSVFGKESQPQIGMVIQNIVTKGDVTSTVAGLGLASFSQCWAMASAPAEVNNAKMTQCGVTVEILDFGLRSADSLDRQSAVAMDVMARTPGNAAPEKQKSGAGKPGAGDASQEIPYYW